MTQMEIVGSVRASASADATAGRVRWDPVHSLWNGAMAVVTIIAGPFLLTAPAFLIFIVLTGAVLLLGHSVGFHRRLIHESFACPLWLEHLLVWVGTLVGMSGPFWMIRTHDLRDWAQRQPGCHPYLSHASAMAKDYWWQVHCRLELDHPPAFDLGRAGRDRLYRFLERSWMVQQLPIMALLFWAGGWSFIIWGGCARIFICVHGHWLVGHLAHRRGPQHWLVDGAGVQAHDVPWAGFLTMGEAWHNNHHAYPGSARIGLYRGQSDPGYRFITILAALGLAWDIRTPATMQTGKRLIPVGEGGN